MAALAHSIRRNALGLGLFAVITGGTIALTQAVTAQRIEEQAARAEAQALFEIIPESDHDNDLLKDTVKLPAAKRLGSDGPLTVWVARLNQQPVGMIMPVVAPDGYSGNIRMLVGVNLQGQVLGVRVTSHKETPGLGDRIETKKSDWIEAFAGQVLGESPYTEWNVRKNGGEFDQFTGATITPQAVVTTVREALVYFREYREIIRSLLNEQPEPRDRALTPGAIAGESTTLEHS